MKYINILRNIALSIVNNRNANKGYRDYRPLYEVDGYSFKAKRLTNEEMNKLVQSSALLNSTPKKSANSGSNNKK